MIQEWHGHRLCSTRDPQKEGSQWAALQKIEGDHCWVMGLGSGFHIAELVKQFPNTVISVLDHRADLKDNFEQEFEIAGQVQTEIVIDELELLATKSFSLFGASISNILWFRPAIQGFENMYQDFSKTLRGQTPPSCLALSQLLNLGLSPAEISNFQEFQVKEIDAVLKKSGNPDARAWVAALTELVR